MALVCGKAQHPPCSNLLRNHHRRLTREIDRRDSPEGNPDWKVIPDLDLHLIAGLRAGCSASRPSRRARGARPEPRHSRRQVACPRKSKALHVCLDRCCRCNTAIPQLRSVRTRGRTANHGIPRSFARRVGDKIVAIEGKADFNEPKDHRDQDEARNSKLNQGLAIRAAQTAHKRPSPSLHRSAMPAPYADLRRHRITFCVACP